jgi:hypothetical protein
LKGCEVTDKKSLEEALAELEARNAKAAALRAKQAPELIAAAVKRTALNARLAALPQAQRRQVLDAAGLNHETAAPEPITPVSGRNAPPPRVPVAPVAPRAIDWAFWRNMHTVKLWQACALVVGVDPDQLKYSRNGWMAGPNAGPRFEDSSFPNLEAKERYGKAVRLAESAVSYMDGPIFPQGTPHPGNNKEKDVSLSEVVAFFVSCEWAAIPEKLQATSQTSRPVKAAPVATAPTTEQTNRTVEPKFSMKQAGLIAAHKHEWSTIERDLKDASENGLSAAKAGPREWDEATALQWARAKGKLKLNARPVNDLANAVHSMTNLPGQKFTLKG